MILVLQGQVSEKVRGDVVTTFNPIHASRTFLYHLSDTW